MFRAGAALWVLVTHCLIWGGWHGLLIPGPKIAVDLFLVISGYLMSAGATARSAHEPMSSAQSRWRFWTRRYFRIAPAYYLSLLLAAVMSGPFLAGYQTLQSLAPENWAGSVYNPEQISFSFESILLHVAFLFGLLPEYSFSTFLPDWSLSLEMQFYAAFPLIWLIVERYGTRAAMILGTLSVAVGALIADAYPEPSALPIKLHCFLAGMLLFRALDTGRRELLWCAVLLMALEYRYRVYVVCLPVLVLLMYGAARAQSRWLVNLMRHRVVRFAADASYGVYLFQGFFISAFGLLFARSLPDPAWRTLWLLAFALVCSYASAYAIFRLIERPGIALGKRLTRAVHT